jgi:hypothetical protein
MIWTQKKSHIAIESVYYLIQMYKKADKSLNFRILFFRIPSIYEEYISAL